MTIEWLQVVQLVFGILFALLVPGYLVVMIFFRWVGPIQKVALAMLISVIMTTLIGIFLGYNRERASVTGGITTANVWKVQLVISAILLVVVLILYLPRQMGSGVGSLKQERVEHGKRQKRTG
ncbi:hypothetical protein JXB02_02220 [Candidatus Woesearchaeota archaeon]|nr:hypothetical protein [Candidatus Woesearchaeota archaeon]